jgi:hypothetical protein
MDVRSLTVVALLLTLAFQANSQPATLLADPPLGVDVRSELIASISEADERTVESANDYFLKKETYFARRYRIVKVDTDLLLSAAQFTISLFDELSVSVRMRSVDVDAQLFTVSWQGEFIEPRISVDDLVATGIEEGDAKLLEPHVNGLRISAAQVSFDETARIAYPYYFPRFEKFRNTNREVSPSGQPALYHVGFVIQGAILPAAYELRPLLSDSQHHVLIELDPSKLFTEPIEPDLATAGSEYQESPENMTKRQRYEDFLESLGPDPRPADFHQD